MISFLKFSIPFKSKSQSLNWTLACLALLTSLTMAQHGVRAEKIVPDSAQEIQLSFAPLVKKAAPAVVNIFTKKTVKTKARKGLFDDPFFEQFFGSGIRKRNQSKKTQSSLGSGVIVQADGIVVTNYHVVAGADTITVALQDRREFDAKLILEDERTDLAVLKLVTEATDLPFLEFADSDDLEVGDLVLAIGNPFGVGQTVTSGIVSALGRTTGVASDIKSFIQTDAAINPGNSGGALLTMDGKIAGINSAIFSKGGGSLGIGFAIPANLVRSVLINGLATGKVVRPWLGASGQSVTRDVAEGLGLDRSGGVLVNQVYSGSAADLAGLKVGDVIISVNGHEVLDPQGLLFRISTGTLGTKSMLGVFRDNGIKEISVPLMAAPENPPRDEILLKGQQPLNGAVVGNLSPAYAIELGVSSLASGVIVAKVQKGSIAERYRIRPFDIALMVNGQKVTSSSQLQALLNSTKDKWAVTLLRKGRKISFEVTK
ncbi:MAG: Do family serine endopeptidase [Sneathiella sp.]|nr:Do family serine endopeptidase [Sneathiella sp.]